MFDFKSRLGPLPIWAWGLIFGGAVVGFYYWQQLKDSNGALITDDNEAAAESESSVLSLADAIDGAFTPGTAYGSSLATVTVAESADTNSAWAKRAIDALVGKGKTPLEAQAAIGRYLEGEELSTTDAAMVNTAIQSVGQPPEGAPIPANTSTETSIGIKSWRRQASGQIEAVMSDGTVINKSLAEYIAAGMPGFTYNAYETKLHKAAYESTTVAAIAKKYGTTVENIMVLNGWKTVPDIKKGQKVKVPVRKG